MSYDNRIFNVNGIGNEMLLNTLNLAFAQKGVLAQGWSIDKKRGMILYSRQGMANSGIIPFPIPLKAEEVFHIIKAWLDDADAKTIECVGDDEDFDHDGHNNLGWRIYCDSMGRVGDYKAAFIAIKPAYIWYGK